MDTNSNETAPGSYPEAKTTKPLAPQSYQKTAINSSRCAHGACSCDLPCSVCSCRPPSMSMELKRLLLAYKKETQSYAEATGERTASRIVDAADFILIESDRYEGGRDD